MEKRENRTRWGVKRLNCEGAHLPEVSTVVSLIKSSQACTGGRVLWASFPNSTLPCWASPLHSWNRVGKRWEIDFCEINPEKGDGEEWGGGAEMNFCLFSQTERCCEFQAVYCFLPDHLWKKQYPEPAFLSEISWVGEDFFWVGFSKYDESILFLLLSPQWLNRRRWMKQ